MDLLTQPTSWGGCHLLLAFASGGKHPDGVTPLFLEMQEMEWTGSTTMLTGKNIIFTHILLCSHNLLNVRFVDRDMLLYYHWGHGVGHVYSHTQTEFSSSANTVSISADVELDLNTGCTHN